MTLILFLVGLVALFVGGEVLVRGASGIARALKLSPLVIGMTVVGFGTSMPELLVSVRAALSGSPGIAIGNVVGSNIANVLLILGVSAVLSPIAIGFAGLRRDLIGVLAATVLLWLILLGGVLSRPEGLLLLAALALFLWVCLRQDSDQAEEDPALLPPARPWVAIIQAIAGMAALMLGARLLVDSAVEIATTFGISEAVIGLTIVAVGTSLPELATSIMAAMRRNSEIAVGNVIGSNLFNILCILGVTSAITPVPAGARFLFVDIPVSLAAIGLLAVLIWRFGGLSRLWGGLFLTVYAAYVAVLGVA